MYNGCFDGLMGEIKYNLNMVSLFIICAAMFLSMIYFAVKNAESADAVQLLFLAAVCAILVYIRMRMFDNLSRDYMIYLKPWLAQLSVMTLKDFLSIPVGNYNLIYMYFLYAISKIPVNSVYLVKGLSCLFDVLTAYYAMKLVSLKKSKINLKLITYFTVLALPTVILNSAYWGQCDSIYTAFALAGLYYALIKRPSLSAVMFGLSLAFKFQAVLALPVLIILLFKRRLQLIHLAELAGIYIVTLLPALFAGRSVHDTFFIYFSQVQSQSDLTYNAATFYTLMGNASYYIFNSVGIAAAALVALTSLYEAYRNAAKLKNGTIIDFLFAFSLFLPYFLPSMHDRYFYIADICAIIYFVYHNRRWYFPAVLFLCSFNDYSYYLFGGYFIDEHLSAIIRGVIILLVIKDYFTEKGLLPEKYMPSSKAEGHSGDELNFPVIQLKKDD
jgi:Gpi18-like mannosyltransferase